jgi:hypothetical protein
MPARFQRSRWSETRRKIDAMPEGGVLRFGADQYHNCKATVDRLNDAYAGARQYTLSGCRKTVTVTRAKQAGGASCG